MIMIQESLLAQFILFQQIESGVLCSRTDTTSKTTRIPFGPNEVYRGRRAKHLVISRHVRQYRLQLNKMDAFSRDEINGFISHANNRTAFNCFLRLI